MTQALRRMPSTITFVATLLLSNVIMPEAANAENFDFKVGANLDFKKVSVQGLKLGKTAREVLKSLKAAHPKEPIHIATTICKQDYDLALKAGRQIAPQNCIDALQIMFDSQTITTGFVEDLSGKRYGNSILTGVSYQDSRLKSGADASAFLRYGIAKYSKPNYFQGTGIAWCGRSTFYNCEGSSGLSMSGNYAGPIKPNTTPIGYLTERSHGLDYRLDIFLDDASNGNVILLDFRTYEENQILYSTGVNLQTVKPQY